jgi:5-methylcytosine-specific restriction enzyme subunit McrC
VTLVELPELGPGLEVDLGPEERRALQLLGRRLRVEWLGPERARISPSGYVGSVRLSERLTINVRTKIPVSNILGLASLAYRRLPLPGAVGETDLREGEPLDWLAFLIVLEVEALLARGMRQGYVNVEDELPYVRGRIQFTAAARAWTHPGLVACEFSDFIPDTPENRVLRSTLEVLGRSRLLPGLRARVMAATAWLADVALVPLSPQLMSGIRLTRLNAHYSSALELCRLYLEGHAVEQPTGEVAAPAFLFPMEQVFEAAVANYLATRRPDLKIQPQRSLAPTTGEPAHALTFRPDLVVGQTPALLVLDTKYANPERKTQFGTRSFRNNDLYQIAFYANEYGSPGLLVYPRAERDVLVTFDAARARCTIATVDLGQPDLAGLEALEAIVEDLVEDPSTSSRVSASSPRGSVVAI